MEGEGLPQCGLSLLLAVHRRRREHYPHLCASTASSGESGRYSILFACPRSEIIFHRGRGISHDGVVVREDNFLAYVVQQWRLERDIWAAYGAYGERACAGAEIPFRGGWFVYVGYELIEQWERHLILPSPPQSLPDACATRCAAALIYDHQRHRLWAMHEGGEDAAMSVAQMEEDVRACACARTGGEREQSMPLPSIHMREDEEALYMRAFKRCIEYIYAGDVFQVNLSRLWRGLCHEDMTAADIFERLARHNPAPFAALATWCHQGEQEKAGDGARIQAVISSSPERLVRVDRHGVIETRPIAGTRPRLNRDMDREKKEELLAHPKERAEHIMLVDLERNDLSKICRAGSVSVDEMMIVESYAHVHHIVSNVRGVLSAQASVAHVLEALFPGGTITGCPKLRCMEILAELEHGGRGPYTGSLGYVNHDGSLDMNILIRTIVCDGRELTFRAGGGIVAESVAEQELEETRAKARGMVNAVAG
ncbi:MAG: aminodeoxychorismate synthase component I [Alphaproteobacteria bacterium GM7ARS4]|nr:aminodeoxychorismate synthase component I [Alphaproteobacteria bacterium GM7ARS4]